MKKKDEEKGERGRIKKRDKRKDKEEGYRGRKRGKK